MSSATETSSMTEAIQAYIPLIAIAWTIISFWVGHFVGHKTALSRDKRKEFNAIVSPIRVELLKQINTIKSGDYEAAHISMDSIVMIADLSSNPNSIMDAYKNFKYANSHDGLEVQIDEYGDRKSINTSKALSAAENLIRLIPLR